MKTRRVITVWIVALACVAAACSPTLNWREVRFDDAPLIGLLPCKPDRGARTLPIGGQPTQLTMQGCEADGHLFTLAHAELAPAADVQGALKAWKQSILANAGATNSRDLHWAPPGATPMDAAVMARFEGQSAGHPVVGQTAFFARGVHVFQAAIYSQRTDEAAAETFFGGLRVTQE